MKFLEKRKIYWKDIAKYFHAIDNLFCKECSKLITRIDSYCAITRIDNEATSGPTLPIVKFKTELYHNECFVKIAGKEIFHRLTPHHILINTETENMCKTCGISNLSIHNQIFLKKNQCDLCNVRFNKERKKDFKILLLTLSTITTIFIIIPIIIYLF